MKHPRGKIENAVIGSLVGFLLGGDDPDGVIRKMASEDTRIVSLTITEGGYNFDATGEFDFGNPDVRHDLEHPARPKTVFGFLTAALRERRSRGLPAFTVQSCAPMSLVHFYFSQLTLSCVFVVDKGRFTGMITKADIVRGGF